MPGYDPVENNDEIRDLVASGDKRKYYRFRSDRFYGGIATADCVGYNLISKTYFYLLNSQLIY